LACLHIALKINSNLEWNVCNWLGNVVYGLLGAEGLSCTEADHEQFEMSK
jgi:hypothetical protein